MKLILLSLIIVFCNARICDDIKIENDKLYIHFSDFTETKYFKIFDLNKVNYQFIYKNNEIYEIKSDDLPCTISDKNDKKILENKYFKKN